MLESLIFSYIFKRTRNIKKRLNGAKRSEDDVDGTDDTETKRSAINKVLLVWGIVESFSLILVLLRMFTRGPQRGYPENFMNGLCKSAQKCDTLVIRIILYKLLSSIALIIGAVYVRHHLNVFEL